MNSFKKGFTLIELLVVISIIALLSSVVLTGLMQAREKAQVTAIRTYFKEIVTALELYKSNTGTYPLIDGAETKSISLLVNEELSGLIQQQTLPTNIIEENTAPTYWRDGGIAYSCGSVNNTESYIIYYHSSKELPLPKLIIDQTGLPYTSGNIKYYCASIAVN